MYVFVYTIELVCGALCSSKFNYRFYFICMHFQMNRSLPSHPEYFPFEITLSAGLRRLFTIIHSCFDIHAFQLELPKCTVFVYTIAHCFCFSSSLPFVFSTICYKKLLQFLQLFGLLGQCSMRCVDGKCE